MNFRATRVLRDLVVSAACVMLLAPLSQGQIRGVTCGATLSVPGRYTLGTDLNCSGTAITIAGSGVELSLAGHRISGSNLDVGIQVDLLGGGRILGPGTIALSKASAVGINVFFAQRGVEVMGVTTTGGAIGFSVDDAKVVFHGNAASGSGTGFMLLLSDGSDLSGNMATGNSAYGFSIGGSRNHIVGNTAMNNGQHGIHVNSGSTNNQITNNTAMGNHAYDLFDGNGACANVWASNTFRTANLRCIH